MIVEDFSAPLNYINEVFQGTLRVILCRVHLPERF